MTYYTVLPGYKSVLMSCASFSDVTKDPRGTHGLHTFLRFVNVTISFLNPIQASKRTLGACPVVKMD